jgi:hypothetical protein
MVEGLGNAEGFQVDGCRESGSLYVDGCRGPLPVWRVVDRRHGLLVRIKALPVEAWNWRGIEAVAVTRDLAGLKG